jgi:hypothetical protein
MASQLPSKLTQKSWLDRYIKVQQSYDKDLFRILERAASDAEREIKRLQLKDGIGAATRAAQLTSARGSIGRLLAYLWKQVGDLTRAGRLDAQASAILQSFNWEEFLLSKAIPEKDERTAILEFLLDSADKNVDAMLARVFQIERTLSQRVFNSQSLSRKWVSDTINSALARGATANELASEVKDMIRPDTKGGVSFAAKRLARTEINNAYHAQAIDSARDKPWLTGMRWKLSETHRISDACNRYAEQDHGVGSGVWPIGMVPAKPHPQCLCYVIPELPSVTEFNRNLSLGMYDSYFAEYFSADIDTPGKLAG